MILLYLRSVETGEVVETISAGFEPERHYAEVTRPAFFRFDLDLARGSTFLDDRELTNWHRSQRGGEGRLRYVDYPLYDRDGRLAPYTLAQYNARDAERRERAANALAFFSANERVHAYPPGDAAA